MIETIKIALIVMLTVIVLLQEAELRSLAKELVECDPTTQWGWFQ